MTEDFKQETDSTVALRQHLATINDLHGAGAVLGWDERTKMPPGGTDVRSERLATLGRLAHEMFVSEGTARLLEDAERDRPGLDENSDEAALIRFARRDFDRNQAISPDLMAESIRASTQGYAVWIKAREAEDFSAFLPALERIVDVNRQFIAAFRTVQPDAEEDYDLLLEEFEPGITSREIAEAFSALRDRTIPLVDHVRKHADLVDDSRLHGDFPVEAQERLSKVVLERLGFDANHWRLDETHHPFASSMGTTDIRITTRYLPDFFNSALFGSMHEFGHGLYERQVSPTLERTPLARGTSMAWHESQSRMWENLVGRGRPFWDWAIDPVQEVFPNAFGDQSADDMFRAVNKLQPSLIRVEADELTYNLHIILRFELEREILGGTVALKDLPEAWNQRMRDYLGIEVPNDAVGVLQDVHWSSGLFGYFPTYALGNVLSLQLWDRISKEIPGLEDNFRAGEFAPLRAWLEEHVHCHGSKYLPKDLMERVLGTRKLDPGPLADYLERKVNTLYG